MEIIITTPWGATRAKYLITFPLNDEEVLKLELVNVLFGLSFFFFSKKRLQKNGNLFLLESNQNCLSGLGTCLTFTYM